MKLFITLYILLFSAIAAAAPLDLNAVSKKILNDDPRNNDLQIQLIDKKDTLKFCVEGIGEFFQSERCIPSVYANSCSVKGATL